jgi:hypothetical protein
VDNKPATVGTGITVQVPLFIKQDEKILVDISNRRIPRSRKFVSARRKARKRALDFLFEGDLRGTERTRILSIKAF